MPPICKIGGMVRENQAEVRNGVPARGENSPESQPLSSLSSGKTI